MIGVLLLTKIIKISKNSFDEAFLNNTVANLLLLISKNYLNCEGFKISRIAALTVSKHKRNGVLVPRGRWPRSI